jgi:methylated-DNA-[protein]-cysteine S-methyltransferase
MTSGFSLFGTSIGRCAIVWGERGILGLQLPDADDDSTLKRVRHQYPDAREAERPPEIDRAVDEVRHLLQGEPRDLSSLTLDVERIPEFDRRVYEIARATGPGETTTYGEIATRLGDIGLSRAVGQALGRNPWPLIVPCHRVLAAGGRPGGFSAAGGVATKRRLLEIEGAKGLHPTLPGL